MTRTVGPSGAVGDRRIPIRVVGPGPVSNCICNCVLSVLVPVPPLPLSLLLAMALTPEQFFGKIAVKNGIIQQDQLDACFRLQQQRLSRTGVKEPLSFILYEKKLVTHEQAKDLLLEFKYSCLRRDDKELAAIAVDKGYLTQDEIQIALKYQRKLFREGVGVFQLGEILISKEIMTAGKVFELSCELWMRRNPGKPLPPSAAEQLANTETEELPSYTPGDAAESVPQTPSTLKASDSGIMPAVGTEAEKIRQSTGGHRECGICGYKNPSVATLCYGCGEPLAKPPR
jgi:hypothetical protein